VVPSKSNKVQSRYTKIQQKYKKKNNQHTDKVQPRYTKYNDNTQHKDENKHYHQPEVSIDIDKTSMLYATLRSERKKTSYIEIQAGQADGGKTIDRQDRSCHFKDDEI
jgi:hypothetical protein